MRVARHGFGFTPSATGSKEKVHYFTRYMRRLGEILLDRGALALSELHTGLDACRRRGGRLGTQLLRFGFVDERVLLAALAEQYGVPSAATEVIARAPLAVRRLLPVGVMKRLQVVPFDRAASGVRVAMINPRDPMAADEIRRHLGDDFEPFVATEIALEDAIAELDEGPVRMTVGPEETTPREARLDVDGWEALWRPPSMDPAALLDRDRDAADPPPRIRLATFPGLATMEGRSGAAEITLDESAYIDALQDVQHRDEVGALLTRFAVGFLPRCALLMIHKGEAVGWMARGLAVVDDVQTFVASLAEPSMLQGAANTGEPQAVVLGAGDVDRRLAAALGDPPPVELVIVPVQVKGRSVALLVGDLPGEAVLAVPMSDLSTAAVRAGLAFEMLIMRQKIAS